MTEKEIENYIREFFEENYETMKLSGGHMITDYLKRMAYHQVLFYYRKNKELIGKITEAEVKLALPDQHTPKKKNRYTIEGVIDIVRQEDETWMYDLKTHDRASVENNVEMYRSQLNVYAFIWKTLRGNELDNTAVISTSLPVDLRHAIDNEDESAIHKALSEWDPIIPLGYSEKEVEAMIRDFGEVVEKIESGIFTAPLPKRLDTQDPGEHNTFAVRVCRNCDTRFSCSSFRSYVKTSGKGAREFRDFLNDYGTEIDRDEFIDANLNQEKIDKSLESTGIYDVF